METLTKEATLTELPVLPGHEAEADVKLWRRGDGVYVITDGDAHPEAEGRQVVVSRGGAHILTDATRGARQFPVLGYHSERGASAADGWRCCKQFDVVLKIDRRTNGSVGNITVNDRGTADEWLAWGLIGAGDDLTEPEADQADDLDWAVRFCPFCGTRKVEK